ncbi:hypothetical protein N9139_02305, partial [Akkermansiaceae bacterium]|nr:hypothetical protein [Akkermansiaceae bacterium]
FPFRSSMLIHLGCYIASTSAFYRRETIIAEEHLLNLDFKYVMDGEYYARLDSLGKNFVYFPRVLAEFRQHGGNLSLRNYGKSSVDDWLVLQKQFAETRAIRRAYGKVWLNDENLNVLVDSLFYVFWRVAKPLLKLIHLPRLEKD